MNEGDGAPRHAGNGSANPQPKTGTQTVRVESSDAVTLVTAKGLDPLPQKSKKLPQKPEVESVFAVTDDLFSEGDFAVDYDLLKNVDSLKWRIEKRFYKKQDGTIMMYYNYRLRKGRYVEGKRVNVYKKGGKKTWLKPKNIN